MSVFSAVRVRNGLASFPRRNAPNFPVDPASSEKATASYYIERGRRTMSHRNKSFVIVGGLLGILVFMLWYRGGLYLLQSALDKGQTVGIHSIVARGQQRAVSCDNQAAMTYLARAMARAQRTNHLAGIGNYDATLRFTFGTAASVSLSPLPNAEGIQLLLDTGAFYEEDLPRYNVFFADPIPDALREFIECLSIVDPEQRVVSIH
jgi:hypothetical protein